MTQVTPLDDQAVYRAALRRSGALRNGMISGSLHQSVHALQDRLLAWFRRPADKDAARPRRLAG